MTDITNYILAKTVDDEERIVSEVGLRLQESKIKLIEVVQSIGPYITDDDVIQQAKAIQYVSAVLAQLTEDRLSRQDVALISQFFTSRFKIPNVPGVRENAYGLRTLTSMSRFNPKDASDIASAIFNNRFDFPNQVAVTRQEVYKLLHNLILKHRLVLISMKSEFIDGFLELSKKETDPRNLMIVFSILPIVMAEFEYETAQNTALWDAVARYFPITFRPKPNDPIGITADDLKLKLRGCIASTSSFAPLAFPFLIQKLDDQTIANVKKDVMRTIAACAKSYDPSTISLWSFQIWEALKYEVLSATDDDLAQDALDALTAVAERLAYGLTMQTLDDTPLHRYISLIVTDCNGYLREPEQRHARQAGQIVSGISASSPLAFHLIVKGILPPLFTIYKDLDALSKKRCLLEVVNGILDSRLALQTLSAEQSGIDGAFEVQDDSIESGGLHHFRDQLLEVYTIALTRTVRQESKFRETALQGLLKLARIPLYLTKPEVGMIAQHLTEEVLDQNDSNTDLRQQAILALQKLGIMHMQQVADNTFPALLSTLPDTLANGDNGESQLNTLGALGQMSAGADLFETFSIRLLSKLDVVLHNGSSLTYAKIILTGLLFGVKQHEKLKPKTDSADQNEDKLGVSIVERLLRKVTAVGVLSDGPFKNVEYIGLRSVRGEGEPVYVDDDTLDLIGNIIMVVVRSMTLHQQQLWLVPNIIKLCSTVGPQLASIPSEKWYSASLYEPAWLFGSATIASHSTQSQPLVSYTSIAILSSYLLAGLRKELSPPFHANVVCLTSLQCAVHNNTMSTRARRALQNTAALLVNKHRATAPSVDTSCPSATEYITSLISISLSPETSLTPQALHHTLSTIYTFTAAANLSIDRNTTSLLTHLLSALDTTTSTTPHSTSHAFATHFSTLLAPSTVLTAPNHATIRQLSKARLFGTCIPPIITSFRSTHDASVKANYLIALAGILKWTPEDVILPQIETLLPLLLQSLELSSLAASGGNEGVKSASLDCLALAIVQVPEAAEAHVASIIRILTSLWCVTPAISTSLSTSVIAPSTEKTTTTTTSNSADLRAKALNCLALIPGKLRDIVTLPFKRGVLRDLEAAAVGDSKRRVRVEAVDCRAAWGGLAEPKGEEDD